MSHQDVSALRALIEQAQAHVESLRRASRDHPGVRRLVNDLDRLAIDVDEVAGTAVVPAPTPPAEPVPVPDTPYAPDFWHGADDEGVGGYRPFYR
ncbi:hypothetical protein FHX81_6164 [Saccharothrix saharensis]|uniref:Uncharacterized protein n=1 Tax=Saccharothrix saharensis TaxID=571190 RepID=A0A543JLI9_9PSEU|nr:hypothetical protein [Saccharothrix saharensis]TQM83737.1 hypothetical protein FHX81_6164 [Saccharothrix saharensis]